MAKSFGTAVRIKEIKWVYSLEEPQASAEKYSLNSYHKVLGLRYILLRLSQVFISKNEILT